MAPCVEQLLQALYQWKRESKGSEDGERKLGNDNRDNTETMEGTKAREKDRKRRRRESESEGGGVVRA